LGLRKHEIILKLCLFPVRNDPETGCLACCGRMQIRMEYVGSRTWWPSLEVYELTVAVHLGCVTDLVAAAQAGPSGTALFRLRAGCGSFTITGRRITVAATIVVNLRA